MAEASNKEVEKKDKKGQAYIWQGVTNAPKTFGILQSKIITQVALGENHCVFLSRDGEVYSYGNNQYGQLGIGTLKDSLKEPTLVTGLQGRCITHVASGSQHTAAVCAKGSVFCWGDSREGQCGTLDHEMLMVPNHVSVHEEPASEEEEEERGEKEEEEDGDDDDEVGIKICQVACGKAHTLALSGKGEIWAWGSGAQLGLFHTTKTSVPQRLNFLHGRKVLSIACGAFHSMAILQALTKSEASQTAKLTPQHRKKLTSSTRKSSIQVHKYLPSTCVDCKQEIYTYTENNDTCIINDKHKCPLGLELSKAQSSSGDPSVNHDWSGESELSEDNSSSSTCTGGTVNKGGERKSGTSVDASNESGAVKIDGASGTDRTTSIDTSSNVDTCKTDNTSGTVNTKDTLNIGGTVNTSSIVNTPKALCTDGISKKDSENGVTLKSTEGHSKVNEGQISVSENQNQSAGISEESHSRDESESCSTMDSEGVENAENRSTEIERKIEKKTATSEENAGIQEGVEVAKEASVGMATKRDSASAAPSDLDLNQGGESVDMETSLTITVETVNEPDQSFTYDGTSLHKSRSAFLDEKEAKQFLARQLSVSDAEAKVTSVTPSPERAVCHFPDDQPTSPLSKIASNIINSVPVPTTMVTSMVNSITTKVVSNIKTTVEHFGFVSSQNNIEYDSISMASSQDSASTPTDSRPPSLECSPKRRPHTLDMGSSLFDETSGGNTVMLEDGKQGEIVVLKGQRSSSMKNVEKIFHDAMLLDTMRKTSLTLPTSMVETTLKEMSGESCVCIDTEVWSWGRGRSGQLGLGDILDRPQPSCIKAFKDKHVIKVVAGEEHSLALTANCEAFTWGLNSYGQLGHSEMLPTSPAKVKLVTNTPIWDIAGGQYHSLFLADGILGGAPDIYLAGKMTSGEAGSEEAASSSPCRTQPIRCTNIRKSGWISQVSAGGALCSCLSDRNVSGQIATLHEFAALERTFYTHLYKLTTVILVPFLSSDAWQNIETSSCGPTLRLMLEAFMHLTNVVGINSVELMEVIQGRIEIYQTHIIGNYEEFLGVFQHFSKCFGDALALGAYEHCGKNAGAFFEKLGDVFKEFLEEGKVDKGNSGVTFRRLMQIPLRHMKDYCRILNKVALNFSNHQIEKQHLSHLASLWDNLKQAASQEHVLAENTRAFWEACPQKFAKLFGCDIPGIDEINSKEALRLPGRRLLRESKTNPIAIHQAGRFSSHWLLLFSDIFVHAQYSAYAMYPLATIWVEPPQDPDHLPNALCLTMPEETIILNAPSTSEKGEWLRAINQAVDKVLTDQKNMIRPQMAASRAKPPLARQATHTFTKYGSSFKDATYVGMWLSGKPHGQGEFSWSDGRKYTGRLKHGVQHGHGKYTVPKPDGYEIYDGNWREGKRHGLGCIMYANGDQYEGYFKDDLRHGHGVLKKGKLSSPLASVYIGEWYNDKRQGYGVLDDILKGEKYMGMWENDCRHGNGIIVTLDGMYFEGNFVQNKMSGFGLMMTEDNSSYEGEFTGGPQLYGKGTLTLPNGDHIDGHFSGTWSEGIKVNGVFRKNTEPINEKKGFTHALGIIPKSFGTLSVPASGKWEDIFQHCRAMLGCQGNKSPDCTKAWEVVAVMVTAGKRSLQKAERRGSVGRNRCDSLEDLEKIPAHKEGILTIEYYQQIKTYLCKAFDTPFHPLGKLMEGLVDVYRATYVGVGAHPRLLYHAVQEVMSYVKRVYRIVRILFPDLIPGGEAIQIYLESSKHSRLPKEGDEKTVTSPTMAQMKEEEEEESLVISAAGLLHSILLPKIYPPLFTLYALYNEREDEVYWERVTKWNKQSDIALLSFLGVDQRFWLIDESLYVEKRQRLSAIKDQCYSEGIETLQQISTAFSPAEKLKVIQRSFNEINKSVQSVLGNQYFWNMDDLFPVFQYVVVRARLRQLGAEIHLIDDLMEAHLEHGELGIMFTTLKACYFQIKSEKVHI